MGADNLDIFKRIVFGLPPLKYQIPAVFILGTIYSLVMFGAFQTFTSINTGFWVVPYIALMLFILPALISAEVLHRFLPDYPRKWGYFLALVNQLSIFLYTLILSGANNIQNAWSIIWLGLITIYLVGLMVLIVSVGIANIKRIAIVSGIHPTIILGTFHFFLGRFLEISARAYLINFFSVLLAATFLVILLYVIEYLIGSNADVSAFQLTSGLLKKERASLNLGVPAKPDVQTLSIENGERFRAVAPWVHPGPLGGFGGGKLSQSVIDYLNARESGFFLHVPSTHKEDLADPEDVSKIIDSIKESEKTYEASKMISKTYEGVTFYGRVFGDQKIVFMDTERFDDYDVSIFHSMIDTDQTMVVDLHNHDFHQGPEEVMEYGTVDADQMRSALADFLEKLQNVDQSGYRAGHAVDRADKPAMALVEEVGNQKTAIFGVDTNGATSELKELREALESDFEYVLLFSTDTHASVHELARMENQDCERIEGIVREAESSLSDAGIGLTSTKTEPMKLLKMDYQGLTFSINILIRILPLALLVFYMLLWLWMF